MFQSLPAIQGPLSALRQMAACSSMCMLVVERPSPSLRYTLNTYMPFLQTPASHEICNLWRKSSCKQVCATGAIPMPALATVAQPPEPWCMPVWCTRDRTGFRPSLRACRWAKLMAAFDSMRHYTIGLGSFQHGSFEGVPGVPIAGFNGPKPTANTTWTRSRPC